LNISIVIFCYNETDNIEKVLRASFKVAALLSNNYEIIVVDDGSTDSTRDILAKYDTIKTVFHTVNMGIGSAIRTGYENATKEYVCAIPGDGQFNLDELLQVKPFTMNNIYSFYRPETNYNWYRSLLSSLNRVFNKLLLGVDMKDVNWIKVYRKDQLVFADAQLTSSIIESEICAKLIKAGCKPIELPSVYLRRNGGVSTGGSWKTLSKVIKEMYALVKVVYSFNKKLPKSRQ
jgi:dolichol-phosphate mannosyltransferase